MNFNNLGKLENWEVAPILVLVAKVRQHQISIEKLENEGNCICKIWTT